MPVRSPLLPNVPTAVEAGLPKLAVATWAGLFGPAKMPKDVADRLSLETRALLARPEVREQLERNAIETRGSSPAELADFLKEQVDLWRRTIRDVGIEQEQPRRFLAPPAAQPTRAPRASRSG